MSAARDKLRIINTETQGIAAIRINCTVCNQPAARVVDGAFIWHSHHNGQKHINAISIESLRIMLQNQK